MSGNWDDSDSEDDNVEIGNPVIIPRARQPSIAKSLEKAGVQILENPIEGSENNEADASDDSMSVGSDADSDFFVDSGGEVIVLDFDTTASMKKMIALFPTAQRNISSEFADTEIFLISLDSLIIELLEHSIMIGRSLDKHSSYQRSWIDSSISSSDWEESSSSSSSRIYGRSSRETRHCHS